jgi:hypothetical protein
MMMACCDAGFVYHAVMRMFFSAAVIRAEWTTNLCRRLVDTNPALSSTSSVEHDKLLSLADAWIAT